MNIFIFELDRRNWETATIAVIAKTKERALDLIEKEEFSTLTGMNPILRDDLILECNYEIINSPHEEEVVYYNYYSG